MPRTFDLKRFPIIDIEFHNYVNEIGQNFINELSPLLREIPREAVSEGEEEVIQRIDGTTAKMPFKEVNIPGTIKREIFEYGDFDGLVSSIHFMAQEMVAKTEQAILRTISIAAEEHGNVFSGDTLNVDTVYGILERTDLTFDDEGVMQQKFIIHPELDPVFRQIISDPRIQSLIDRKRKEYFAKKNN